MKQKLQKILLIFLISLASCKTIKAYQIVREVRPERKDKPICYYKKISDIQKEKMKCYAVDAKDKDGNYIFKDYLVISKRKFREVLHETIDQVFE